MKIQSTKSLGDSALKILVYGFSSSGKTYLARTVPEKCLIISAESGLLSLKHGPEQDFIDISKDDNNKILPPKERMDKLFKVYEMIQKKEFIDKYKWLFIDSLSEFGDILLSVLRKRYPGRSDGYAKYDDFLVNMEALIKKFRDLPHYNVVMTCLAVVDKDETQKRFIGFNLPGQIAARLPSYFDEVFFLEKVTIDDKKVRKAITTTHMRAFAKDRSDTLDEFEKPDLTAIANKIRGKKDDGRDKKSNDQKRNT